MLIAPLIDSKFSNVLGKSKTYILIAGTGMSILLIILSFRIEDFIHSLNVTSLLLYFLPIMVLLTFQNAAVESWALTLMEKEKQFGGLANMFGYSGGFWIGYPLFSV